ncbi:MAG: hypothetical protein UV70_C0001G0052 [Parcubacteria group bacterium GW2011_GWA2_43_13]|nr:MAG: hypothetical protein UV70_C0001G0052 [Parcubacteria group bacterium GW2011_GWA2_43_13]
MKVLYADEFRKRFHKLPAHIQGLYHKQEDIFCADWRDSRLHVKKLVD